MAFPTGWGRRATVTIGAAQVSGAGALSDFPFLCTVDNLPSEMFDADGSNPALSGGGDIRFSSDEAGSVQLAIDVVSFTINNNPALGTAEIWVKAASIDDSDVFYVWYDKTGETQPATGAAFGRDAVWSGHEAVFHGDDLVDSTGNGHTLTRTGTPTEGNAGKIGGAFTLDGSTEHYDVTNNITSVEPLTLQSWFDSNSASASQTTLSLGRNSANGWMRIAAAGNVGGDPVRVSKTPDSGGGNNADTSTGYSASTWHLGVATFTSTTLRNSYIDGGSKGSNTGSAGTLTGAFTAIGAARRSSVSSWFDGSIDEARILASVLSDDWIATEFNSQDAPGTFATAGTPETPGAPTGNPWNYYAQQAA